MRVGDASGVSLADDAVAWTNCSEDLGLDIGSWTDIEGTLVRVEDLAGAMPAALVGGSSAHLPLRVGGPELR